MPNKIRTPEITEYFDAIKSAFELQTDIMTKMIPHYGERGRNNEEFLRAFLGKVLPKRFSLGSGFLCSSNDELGLSKQTDIVIYDEFYNSPLSRELSAFIYPIESVYATIEVKTTFRGAEFHNSLDAIAKIRRLAEEKRYAVFTSEPMDGDSDKPVVSVVEKQIKLPPRAFIFAYDADGWNEPEALRRWLVQKISKKNHAHVHGLAILKRGWFFSQRAYTSGDERIEFTDGNALRTFISSLLTSISSMPMMPALMDRYLKRN